MIKIMLKKDYQNELKHEKFKGIALMKEKQKKRDLEVKEQEANQLLYKPVYCIGNAWEDPIVGFITGLSTNNSTQFPLYTGLNWITGESFITMGAITMGVRLWCNMDSSKRHISSGVLPLMDITPYERWNLLNRHWSQMDSYRKPTEHNMELMSREVMYQELMATGFFDLVERVMESEKNGTANFTKSIVLEAVSLRQV